MKDHQQVGIVSCDIIAHTESDRATQLDRVTALNAIVAEAVRRPQADTVWASGGDGGHVLFFGSDWRDHALRLVWELKSWAVDQGVPLRVTAHVGEVATVQGADGREQPVGSGINEAGALLDVVGGSEVVASEPFRDLVEPGSPDQVRFHDPRQVLLRGKSPRLLYLMSTENIRSSWSPLGDDRSALQATADSGNAWRTLYHAKRLLQLSSSDSQVSQVLRTLRPSDYFVDGRTKVNPFFAYLNPRALREVVKSSHLIERKANEVLCRYGDEGDTMFVVLEGKVGVYNTAGSQGKGETQPEFVIGTGEVVGELAFLLRRRRTADLITLSDCALLSFSLDEISARLPSSLASDQVRGSVGQFITSRVLEHVAHNVPYLIGDAAEGPLAVGGEPPDSLLEDLHLDAGTISLPSGARATLSALTEAEKRTGGIYILVSGRLESELVPGLVVDSLSFPLVYIDLQPRVLGPDHKFTVSIGGAKLLFVGQGGVEALPDSSRTALYDTLAEEIAKQYVFDAFVSYNLGDEDTVERWASALTDAGLRVYVDSPFPGERFTTKIQAALVNSLTLLAFVSPHTMLKPTPSNWVVKEISFRETSFRSPWIIPVVLRGADLDSFGLRYTMIDARVDERAAQAEAISTIRAIRSGQRPPPLLRSRDLPQLLT